MSARRLLIPFVISLGFSGLWAGEAAPIAPAEDATKKEAAPVEDGKEEAKKEEEKKAGKEKPSAKDQEREIVVTATQIPTSREATGVSISTITNKDIQLNQDTTAAEALRMVPGVAVSQTGRKGGMTELRTRGGEIDHTLMLFDGWKMNRFGDWKSYNFESLDPIGAQRIEIARGPGSALYGSEAMTGTINVISRKGEGRPTLTTSVAAGTYGTDRETLTIEGREKKFSYMAAASRLFRDEASIENSELDIYNWNARFDYDVNEDHSLKLITRGTDFTKGWYENSGSFMGPTIEPPDPNDRIHNEDRLVGLEYSGQIVPIWETIVRLGHTGSDRENFSRLPNPSFAFPGHDILHERRNSVEWRNNVTVFQDDDIRAVITLGAYGEHEYFNQRSWYSPHIHHINYAGYAQGRLELFNRAFITLDGRHEETEEYGAHDTGRADVSIVIPESDTRIHGSVGTAFRAPTFAELYMPFGYGNPGLKPEENFAYDVGIEQHFWGRRIRLGATWFNNDFSDLVTSDPVTWQNVNLATANTRGFELEGVIRPIKHLELQANATLLHSSDDKGQQLRRRPARTYTGRLVVHPLLGLVPDKWSGLDLSFEVLSVSSRLDTGYDPISYTYPSMKNGGYCRGDIAVSYRFLEHFRAFARFENITDTKYQDVLTFPADGANALGGLEFQWRF